LGKQGLFHEIQLGPTASCARTLSAFTRQGDRAVLALVVALGALVETQLVAVSITSKLEERRNAMTPPVTDPYLLQCTLWAAHLRRHGVAFMWLKTLDFGWRGGRSKNLWVWTFVNGC